MLTAAPAPSQTRPTRPGGEKRGNSKDRRARKLWMLATWGDGQTCECVHCSTTLDYATVEADRIVPGGSYRRDNVQPACRRCNASRSNNIEWVAPLAQAA
jgi:5-methylcytosine-specific restriction endonuclease McrA